MRHKNVSRNHGLKDEEPKQRNIKADNAKMPEELRALGRRLKAIDEIMEEKRLKAELGEF